MTRGDGGTKEGKYIDDLPPEERKRLLEDMTLVQEPWHRGENRPFTRAEVEAWRRGLLRRWGYSQEQAELRLQGYGSRLAAGADKGEAFAMQFAKCHTWWRSARLRSGARHAPGARSARWIKAEAYHLAALGFDCRVGLHAFWSEAPHPRRNAPAWRGGWGTGNLVRLARHRAGGFE